MLRYKHINSVSSGSVDADTVGHLTLWTVNVNTAQVGAVLKIYNNSSAVAADLVCSIDASAVAPFCYGVLTPKGMFYDLSGGAADITIGYV